MELGELHLDEDRVHGLLQALQEGQQHSERAEAEPDLDGLLGGFLAGYAAGMAEGSGQADFHRAHRAALGFLTKQLQSGESG